MTAPQMCPMPGMVAKRAISGKEPARAVNSASLRSALRKSWRRTRCSKHPWAAGDSFCGPIQFRPASLSGLRPLEFQDFACMANNRRVYQAKLCATPFLDGARAHLQYVR